jgi:hypothetical protein
LKKIVVCMCFLYINGPTRQYAVIHKNIKNIPKYLKNNNLLSQLVPCKPGGQPHWANPSLFIKHVPFQETHANTLHFNACIGGGGVWDVPHYSMHCWIKTK